MRAGASLRATKLSPYSFAQYVREMRVSTLEHAVCIGLLLAACVFESIYIYMYVCMYIYISMNTYRERSLKLFHHRSEACASARFDSRLLVCVLEFVFESAIYTFHNISHETKGMRASTFTSSVLFACWRVLSGYLKRQASYYLG